MKARLSDEPVFKRMSCNVPLLPDRRGVVIQEQFLGVADLEGQSVEIAPLLGLPATVCYVKMVPLHAEEAQYGGSNRRASRTSIATVDGHSWIWPYRPHSAAELQEEFRGFEDSDVGKWWFQVCGADLVCYPSKVGNIPGEGTTDFPSSTYAAYTHSLQELFKKGINPRNAYDALGRGIL